MGHSERVPGEYPARYERHGACWLGVSVRRRPASGPAAVGDGEGGLVGGAAAAGTGAGTGGAVGVLCAAADGGAHGADAAHHAAVRPGRPQPGPRTPPPALARAAPGDRGLGARGFGAFPGAFPGAPFPGGIPAPPSTRACSGTGGRRGQTPRPQAPALGSPRRAACAVDDPRAAAPCARRWPAHDRAQPPRSARPRAGDRRAGFGRGCTRRRRGTGTCSARS